MGPTSLYCLEEQRTLLLIWGLPSPWFSFEATVQYPSLWHLFEQTELWLVQKAVPNTKTTRIRASGVQKERTQHPSLPLTLVSLKILVPSSSKKLPTPSKLLK